MHVCVHAKSLQSCLTLCDPMDCLYLPLLKVVTCFARELHCWIKFIGIPLHRGVPGRSWGPLKQESGQLRATEIKCWADQPWGWAEVVVQDLYLPPSVQWRTQGQGPSLVHLWVLPMILAQWFIHRKCLKHIHSIGLNQHSQKLGKCLSLFS